MQSIPDGKPVIEHLARLASCPPLPEACSDLLMYLSELNATEVQQNSSKKDDSPSIQLFAGRKEQISNFKTSSGSTGLVFDERFTLHITPSGHPDRPERVLNLFYNINKMGMLNDCRLIIPQPADDIILANHSRNHFEHVKSASTNGEPYLDHPDCQLSTETFNIACLAVGSVVRAIDSVQSGEIRNAFCIVRPGGHHAKYNEAEVFCFFNNIAIGARYLIKRYGLQRVMVLDWDLHHANGTEDAFYQDPKVLVCSIHGHPDSIYPMSGYENERGAGPGEGFTVNVPLRPGCSDSNYRRAFEERIIPAANSFCPQFVLISAGFDAHEMDPMSLFDVQTSTFFWMTCKMMEDADKHCGGKLVSSLEGGYGEVSLPEAGAAHLRALLTA
ncbi:MAG: histone deacetylase [Sedimentisphaerales bacterium]|nr:histone deacetylase [Sedimentisphaerales bacterium]